MSQITTYTIEGMTCQHCSAAVISEVSAIPEVRSVLVDLPSGVLTVDATSLDHEALVAAVEEAGYILRV